MIGLSLHSITFVVHSYTVVISSIIKSSSTALINSLAEAFAAASEESLPPAISEPSVLISEKFLN